MTDQLVNKLADALIENIDLKIENADIAQAGQQSFLTAMTMNLFLEIDNQELDEENQQLFIENSELTMKNWLLILQNSSLKSRVAKLEQMVRELLVLPSDAELHIL